MRFQLILFLTFFISTTLLSDPIDQIKEQHRNAYSLFGTDPNAALIIGQQTESHAHEEGLDLLEANSLFIQAWCYKLLNQRGKSFLMYLKALETLRPTRYSSQEATDLYIQLLRNTAIVLTEHHAYPQALPYFEEAIDLAKKAENFTLLARIYESMGVACFDLKQYDEAITNIKTGLVFAAKSDNASIFPVLINEKGRIEIEIGQTSEARETFHEIINFQEATEDQKALAWLNIGYAYQRENRFDEAIQSYQKANVIWSSIDSKKTNNQFLGFFNLSVSEYERNRIDRAISNANQALEIYPEIELNPKFYEIFDHLSNLYYEAGNFAKSHEYAVKYREENQKFLELQDELMRIKDQYKMEMLAAGFFIEKNTTANESLYMQIIAGITSVFTLLLLAGYFRQQKQKRDIKRSLLKIYTETP